MIRKSYGESKDLITMASFFLNQFSLFYTNKTSLSDNNYRNILGSIPIRKMIKMSGRDEISTSLSGEERKIR